MLADQVDYVVGVDTHRDEHALAVVCRTGGGAPAGTPAHTAHHTAGDRSA